MVAPAYSAGTASDTSASAALAQSTSFCTVGAPLTPIAPTISPSTLIGNPPPYAATRKRGDAGQERRVALDKVEKVLRGDAEQSGIRLILRNLDGKDRRTIHPAECLEIAPSSRIATFSRTPMSLAFATASSTIFCASSEEMLCFFTTLAIGLPPPLDMYCVLIIPALRA